MKSGKDSLVSKIEKSLTTSSSPYGEKDHWKKQVEIPCPMDIHGVRCWGTQVSGTGCTNPDCQRNQRGGGS